MKVSRRELRKVRKKWELPASVTLSNLFEKQKDKTLLDRLAEGLANHTICIVDLKEGEELSDSPLDSDVEQ